jgi:hypothetical protein
MRVVKQTKSELMERGRLEAVASDLTKSEAERELARERIQALRDAAVARAELREIKRAKPVDETAEDTEENPLPVKPERLDGEADKDFQWRIAYWRIRLDKAAAQRALDNPKSALTTRANAERMLRKCKEREEELFSKVDSDDSTDAQDDIPRAEINPNPFYSRHEIGSEAWVREFREQQNTKWDSEGFSLIAWMNAERQWESQHPESYAAERNRRDEEDEARHVRGAEEHSGNPVATSTVVGKPYIASPLQKETWKAQSDTFARQRGEIVATQTAPAVESSERDVIYVLEDDYMFYADSTEAKPPFSSTAKFVRVPAFPPGYEPGSFKIGDCYRYDRTYTCWFHI